MYSSQHDTNARLTQLNEARETSQQESKMEGPRHLTHGYRIMATVVAKVYFVVDKAYSLAAKVTDNTCSQARVSVKQ